MRRSVAAALGAAALLTWAPGVQAQMDLGLGAGRVFPSGRFGNLVETGFHAGAVLESPVPLLPFSARGDLMYQRNGGSGDGPDYRHLAATLNAQVDVVPVRVLSAHVIAGPGLYVSDFHADPDEPEPGWTTNVGLNAGLGANVNLVVLRPFIEVRYHRVLSDPDRAFVPLTIGAFF